MRKGSKHTAESRAKISAALTPEIVARVAEANRGRKHTAATRANMSAAHVGVKLSESHRQALSESHRGNTNWHNSPIGKPGNMNWKKSSLIGVTGDAHPNWKGDDAGYNAIHRWIRKHWPKTGTCAHCSEAKRTQWANVSGWYRRDDREDWIELCQACHTKFDRGRRAKRIFFDTPDRLRHGLPATA